MRVQSQIEKAECWTRRFASGEHSHQADQRRRDLNAVNAVQSLSRMVGRHEHRWHDDRDWDHH